MRITKVRKPGSTFFPSAYIGMPSAAETEKPRATVVIFGSSRAACSHVGDRIERLGVRLDSDLPQLIQSERSSGNGSTDLTERLRHGSETDDLWGWVDTMAQTYLLNLQTHIIAPKYVAVWSDLLLNVIDEPGDETPINDRMYAAQNRESDLVQLISQLNGPVLMVSHDKSFSRPDLLEYDLSQFLGLD